MRIVNIKMTYAVFNVNYMFWWKVETKCAQDLGIILTPGNGPRAEYDGIHCLGPRLGGLDVGWLVLTPGRVIPAELL